MDKRIIAFGPVREWARISQIFHMLRFSVVPRRGIERINKIRYLNKKVGQYGPIGLQGFFWNCPTYVAGREDRPNATVCHPQS
jgi:hypothetical protein